jgi:hypothetical protein
MWSLQRGRGEMCEKKEPLRREALMMYAAVAARRASIAMLHAQPATNVDKVEQVFTAYHADNLAVLNHRHLIDIILS